MKDNLQTDINNSIQNNEDTFDQKIKKKDSIIQFDNDIR